MLQRLFCTMLLAISLMTLHAQSAKEIWEERKGTFLANNIYVVYTGKPVLDSALKAGFSKFWTARPIKGFVTKNEMKDLIGDKSNSFFYTTPYFYNASGGGNHSSRSTSCIFAFNGGKKNTGRYNLLYESTSISYFDTFGAESDMENAVYRLPLMVADLQRDINVKYDTSAKPVFVKEKILLVNENLAKGNKRSDVFQDETLSAWPWKYELMSPEKIATLVLARDSRYMLIAPVLSDMQALVTVYDLASTKVLASTARRNIMRTPWVRDTEMHGLIDQLNGLKKK